MNSKKLLLNEEFELDDSLEILSEAEDEDTKEEKDQPSSPSENKGAETETEDEFDFGDEEEDELSLPTLGKVYTLKQVYSGINSLQRFIEDQEVINEEAFDLLVYLQELKDLFILIVNNVDKYEDKLDTVISLLRKIIITLSKEISTIMEKSNDKSSSES